MSRASNSQTLFRQSLRAQGSVPSGLTCGRADRNVGQGKQREILGLALVRKRTGLSRWLALTVL